MSVNPVKRSVLDPIQSRWSPYRFLPVAVETDKLIQCFEAARWAASSFNDQPWSWIVATRDDHQEFQRILSCLLGPNQDWASNAGALVLSVVRENFAYNQQPNRVALHDLGQAAAHLALQATALGLQVHQMAGIDQAKITSEYDLPNGYSPQTAIAIGYADTSEPSDEKSIDLRQRETGARNRKSLAEQVFCGAWERPAPFASQDDS